MYDPNENGGRDFHSDVKSPTGLFSKNDYFNSVFVQGGDAENELAEFKRKE